jgi:hypothetical protein
MSSVYINHSVSKRNRGRGDRAGVYVSSGAVCEHLDGWSLKNFSCRWAF